MTRKVFNLVSALIWAAQTASIALVAYFSPEHSITINSSIVIVGTAAIEVYSRFVEEYSNTTLVKGDRRNTVSFFCVLLALCC